jgi:hypothetical protein
MPEMKAKKASSDADKKKKKKKMKKHQAKDITDRAQPMLQDVEIDHPVFKESGWAEVEVKEALDHKYAITGYECKLLYNNYNMKGLLERKKER